MLRHWHKLVWAHRRFQLSLLMSIAAKPMAKAVYHWITPLYSPALKTCSQKSHQAIILVVFGRSLTRLISLLITGQLNKITKLFKTTLRTFTTSTVTTRTARSVSAATHYQEMSWVSWLFFTTPTLTFPAKKLQGLIFQQTITGNYKTLAMFV